MWLGLLDNTSWLVRFAQGLCSHRTHLGAVKALEALGKTG